MRMRFSAKQISLTEVLKRKIERRAQFAVGRFGPQVQRLSVHLADDNGHKGGVDKRCRATAVLATGERLVVNQCHTELIAAIDLALERLGEVVARQVARRRQRRGLLSMGGLPTLSSSQFLPGDPSCSVPCV